MNEETNNTKESQFKYVEVDFVCQNKKLVIKFYKKIVIVTIALLILIVIKETKSNVYFDIINQSAIFDFLFLFSSIFTLISFIYVTTFLIIKLRSKENTTTINKPLQKTYNFYDLTSVIPIFMVVVSLINSFLISPAVVKGRSMEPNFYDGENILISSRSKDFERFDVVIVKISEDDYYIKRIIGEPGDKIEYRDSLLYVNDEFVEEPFLDENSKTYCNNNQDCSFNVPLDSYFVLGDNRENSSDSRSSQIGFIKEVNVLGEVKLILTPLNKFGFVD